VLYTLLSLVQITSYDASKSFVEKVKADDKTFSSYTVGDYLISLYLLTQMNPSRADTTSSPMSPMAWMRSSRTRSSRGSMLTSQGRPARRRQSFEGSYECGKLGTRIYIYLVALSPRRVFSLPLQTQQHLLEPGYVSGVRSCSGDGFALGILELDEVTNP